MISNLGILIGDLFEPASQSQHHALVLAPDSQQLHARRKKPVIALLDVEHKGQNFRDLFGRTRVS